MRFRDLLLVLSVLLCNTAHAEERDVEGDIEYRPEGVRANGSTTVWKDLRSLRQVDPTPESLQQEYQAKLAKAPKDAEGCVAFAKWCRERGMEAEAKIAFEAALELKPDMLEARRGLSFTKTDAGWTPAADVLKTKLETLDRKDRAKMRELAAWCRQHSLFDDEWKLLVELVAGDAWDKAAIAPLRDIVARRRPTTNLAPPLRGRWKGILDTTKHHQIKVFAIFAMDYLKPGADGAFITKGGHSLEDVHGWGEPVYACADGTVTLVQDHFPDLPLGKTGKFDEANFVVIQHTDKESTAYGHIRKGSALVKAGDKVTKGQKICSVGNSGASGAPHLHFTLQMPVWDDQGRGQWISIPCRFEGMRLLEASGKACDVDVKLAMPQEGWLLEFPEDK